VYRIHSEKIGNEQKMKNQKRATLIILAITVLATAGFVSAQTYQQVTTITGASDQTTNYFNVPSSEWLLNWTYSSSTPTYAAFYIDVYQQGNNLPVDSIMAQSNQNSGVNYEHNMQPGSYYLKISAANLDSYTITVEAQQATATPTPSVPEFPISLIIVALIAIVTGAVVIKVKTSENK
jgi:hypothetical protein